MLAEALVRGPGQADIERLAEDAIRLDAVLLFDHVEAWLALGLPVESILVELLAPAARCLGRWWEEDRCDFIDVTMGLWRLQEVMHELASGVPGAGGVAPSGRSVLIGAPEGEDHLFGAVMVETCFRRSGWHTVAELGSGHAELEARIAGEWFDVAGLSASTTASLKVLPRLVARLRRASRNPDLVILVGGHAFADEPDLPARVGADAAVMDARRAVTLADRLCARRAACRPLRQAGLA